jgi:phosphate transport system substrate-binding protein
MSPLVNEIAAAFHEQSPNVTLEVIGLDPQLGLGSRFGLEALRKGEVDLALTSWLPPDGANEGPGGLGLDSGWQATAIARDAIAIVVHPSNPLEGLGLLQVQALFGGRAYEWRAVGVPGPQRLVQPVSREAGSGTRSAFEALAMGGQSITPRAVVAPSSQAVLEFVAEHPEAIGYVSMGYLSPGVKVLKIEGELPTPESAGHGAYPLARELWLVTPEEAPEVVQAFVDFALNPAGQGIVGRYYGQVR